MAAGKDGRNLFVTDQRVARGESNSRTTPSSDVSPGMKENGLQSLATVTRPSVDGPR